jgi:ribosomal protein S18 acetylase RimI-like enzyme
MPPTEKLIGVSVRGAEQGDIRVCKTIADSHREALGFLVAAAFTDAMRRGQLFVAEQAGHVVGFVRFNHRVRGQETALYDICVDASAQHRGVGRLLVQELSESCRLHGRLTIALRCPESLPANGFYAHLGFQRIAIEPGRRRPLVLWRLTLREA